MVKFCILPENVNKFKKAVQSGELNPVDMSKMTSAERNELLKKYVGEAHAPKVNAEFESKLLLKNQKQGLMTWAKNVGGVSKQTRMDIISKIQRMDRILDPEEGQAFMASLAERRLGVGITEEQGKAIMDMSRKITEAESKRLPSKGIYAGEFATKEEALEYGRAVSNMTDYINDLRSKAKSMKLSDLYLSPGEFLGKVSMEVAGNAKAINASMDNSAIFRQGWKTMWTNPGIWAKNSVGTFSTIAKRLGGKNVKREVTADIVSRPTYDLMKKAKLYVGDLEEAFPTTLPERVPGLGRLYGASQDAYTAFVHRTRADVFDQYIKMAEKSGTDLTDKKELEAIGNLVNALTGRGSVGKLEPAANVLNNVFFSPRFVASNIQTFTHPLTAGSKFARKQAAKNLVKIVGGTAGVLALANAVRPGSVDWDPRSSDFGKIRIGDTRFDVTGGMSSLAVLASRIGLMLANEAGATDKIFGGEIPEIKSSTTGKLTKLNTGERNEPTGWSTLWDFVENKLSPAGGLIRDIWVGHDYDNNPLTVKGSVGELFTPMMFKNLQETLDNPNSAPLLATMIADGLGIATNTYSPMGGGNVTTWSKSKTDEIQAFKKKVGDDKFNEASKTYDDYYNTWISNTRKKEAWTKLSADEQESLIMKEKSQLKKDIFKMYNFTYKRPKTKKDSSLIESLNKIKM